MKDTYFLSWKLEKTFPCQSCYDTKLDINVLFWMTNFISVQVIRIERGGVSFTDAIYVWFREWLIAFQACRRFKKWPSGNVRKRKTKGLPLLVCPFWATADSVGYLFITSTDTELLGTERRRVASFQRGELCFGENFLSAFLSAFLQHSPDSFLWSHGGCHSTA